MASERVWPHTFVAYALAVLVYILCSGLASFVIYRHRRGSTPVDERYHLVSDLYVPVVHHLHLQIGLRRDSLGQMARAGCDISGRAASGEQLLS